MYYYTYTCSTNTIHMYLVLGSTDRVCYNVCDSWVDISTYSSSHEVGTAAQRRCLWFILEASEADDQTLHGTGVDGPSAVGKSLPGIGQELGYGIARGCSWCISHMHRRLCRVLSSFFHYSTHPTPMPSISTSLIIITNPCSITMLIRRELWLCKLATCNYHNIIVHCTFPLWAQE